MSYTAAKVIEIAKAEIGYQEKATNSNLDSKTANAGHNNFQKFGRDLNKAGYYNGNKNGYAWCDQFYDWCHYKAAGDDAKLAQEVTCQTGPLGAGCKYSMQYYKNAGRFDKNPKVGDQIFFSVNGSKDAEHTGLVSQVTDTQVITIEGNSGDKVTQHSYARNNSKILGYGHPKYATESAKKQETKPSQTVATSQEKITKVEIKKEDNDVVLPELKQGSKGSAVRAMQGILIAYHYSCGPDGADGDFGSKTNTALKAFQKNKGLSNDGVCGPKTWSMLIKGRL